MHALLRFAGMTFLIGFGLLTGCRTRTPYPPTLHPVAPPVTFPVLAEPPRIAVIRATRSATSTPDRSYAQSLSSRTAQWISQNGVPVKTLNDDEVIAGGLRGFSTVILPYCPQPPDALLSALERHLQAGGKMIVFYGTHPRLAALMQVRLDRYRQAPAGQPWSGWTFTGQAPPHTPRHIEQFSANIFTVTPAHPQARVIALWNSPAGAPESLPAWIQTPAGFWMTHILQDGDGAAKSRMLLALCGTLDGGIWRQAADAAGRQTRRLAESPRGHGLNLTASLRDIERARSQSRFAEAIEIAHEAQARDLIRQAQAQSPRSPEFRGIWDHAGTGLYPGDWPRTAELVRNAGFNTLLVYCGSPAETLYRHPSLPLADAARRHGDQLDAAVRAGRQAGLDIHAWLICWRMENAPESVRRQLRRDGRLQVSDTGAPLDWLCPSHPANRAALCAQVRDLALRYPVAGIHLDYIRYKDSRHCYCAGCRARFETALGRPLRQWPAEVRSGALKARYAAWRCEQINTAVAAVAREIKTLRKPIQLSAAVWGYYPGCIDSIGQDWGHWLKQDGLDFVCPMNYTADLNQFERWMKTQTALPGASGKIMAGLGVTAMESRLSPIQTIEQIQVLRKTGAAGFVLFDLNRTLERETLPYLRMGITRP